jgi:PAS domain S-box-containing protein
MGKRTSARPTHLRDASFRALADTAPDAIVTGDVSGTIRYVNGAAERLFGRRADELIGREIAVLMPERLRDAHRAGLARFLETGVARLVGRTVEVTGLRSDGVEIPIELSLGTAGEGADRILTAIIRDLTDRQRRDRHLAAQLAVTAVMAQPHTSAEAPAKITEALTRALRWDVGLLWLAEAGGRLRLRHAWQAEPTATRRFVDASDGLELGAHEGLPGETLSTAAPTWRHDLATTPGFLRRAEAAADGLRSGVWLPIVTAGRPFGVIEFFTREPMPVDDEMRDLLMTVASQVGEHLERLTAQEGLEEVRTRFANAFDHAPIGMALVAPDGRFIDVNPSLCRITEYSRAALLDKRIDDLTHPDDAAADAGTVAAAMAGDIDDHVVEKRYVRASGRPVWVQVSGTVVRSSPVPYLITQIQDVTPVHEAAELRARYAAELRRSNAELEDFAQVAAHDLRTPLRTISGFAELVMRRHGDALGDDGRELLKFVQRGAADGARLLDNLLRYARAESSSLTTEPVDVADVVDRVLTALQSETQARDALVEVGELPVVDADRVQLTQVLQNLVSNAIKFTPEERRPAVQISSDDDGERMVCVSVADNGIGVDPDEAAALFEMFGRGASSARYEGSGIGLAVCARIIGRHGGRLWAERRDGPGSVFRFTLPAAPAAR